MISEREKLEFESLPEFVREPRVSMKDSYVSKSGYVDEGDAVLPKSAELEALWPGVSHDFIQANRRPPSFYLTVGFVAGAIVSLLGVCTVSFIGRMAASPLPEKRIVVAQGKGALATSAGNVIATASGAGGSPTPRDTSGSEPEIIVPVSSTYEVKAGDTLAGIALQNYKRATPRLLDGICKANGLSNANVLNLGQKLVLPDYRPSRQMATGANSGQY